METTITTVYQISEMRAGYCFNLFLFKTRDTSSKLSPVRDFSEQDKLKKSEVM